MRTGVTIIMTFLDSFVRFFVLRLPALLATFVLRPVFINYYGNIRDIFFRLLKVCSRHLALLSLAAITNIEAVNNNNSWIDVTVYFLFSFLFLHLTIGLRDIISYRA